MIIDAETNFLYLSDRLEQDYNGFYTRLIDLLDRMDIKYEFLRHTRDIWARDYMPVQIAEDRFVQFKFDPGYIYEKGLEHTITDPIPVLDHINIEPEFKYDIKLDGGNIVKLKNKAIVTEVIYDENNTIDKKELVRKMQHYLDLEELIVIPPEPEDYTGHSDGMVRFLNENTVILNDYYGDDENLKRKLRNSFRRHNLTPITFPYYPKDVKNELDDFTALGCYINYLQIGGKIILPTFNIPEDKQAINKSKQILRDHLKVSAIETINCHDISWNGGVLNCLGWTILLKH